MNTSLKPNHLLVMGYQALYVASFAEKRISFLRVILVRFHYLFSSTLLKIEVRLFLRLNLESEHLIV